MELNENTNAPIGVDGRVKDFWNTPSKIVEDFINSLNSLKDVCEESEGKNIDINNIMKILPYILKLQQQKSKFYGRSYCRHGDLSIFFNTERKWDRILNIMEKAMKTNVQDSLYSEEYDVPTETFFDTVVDLASYSLLWVGYIVENNPEVLDKFISANNLSK